MPVLLSFLNWEKKNFLQAFLLTYNENTFIPLRSEKKNRQEIFHAPFAGADVEDGSQQRRQKW